jgi:hypothetical protein
MGHKAGGTYGLGVSLALALFESAKLASGFSANASIVDLLRSMLTTAQSFDRYLVNEGVRGRGSTSLNNVLLEIAPGHGPSDGWFAFYGRIKALRGDYQMDFSTQSSLVLVYELGGGIGIAEGQASSPDPHARPLAIQALKNSLAVAKNLTSVVDPSLLEKLVTGTTVDLHTEIQRVSEKYQSDFSNSPIM